MAVDICNATGNFTGAATFAAAETGALATVLNRNTMESLANNASVTSATFTVTNAHVIDAVLLWVRQGAAGSTGTFKVDLQKGGVSQASVTVNRADLPAFLAAGNLIGNLVPVLFKLGSTATGDGGSNWTIVLTNNNGTNNVNYAAATASTTNFTRSLRTTTAVSVAAADDIYIIGELTGAGAHNALTVTMDSTATTAYGNGSLNSTTVAGGGIHCGYYGTFTYGTSASTNYVLRINGDLWVWEQGPLSIGASGTEIPRTSTAVLEFQQASANGDFGLRIMDNAVFNAAGLSRTSGKNVTKCKLTADLTGNCVLTSGPTTTNGANTSLGSVDPTGVSLLASSFADNSTNGNHSTSYTGPSITNTTQVAQVYLARGSGTNNRFVRVVLGNATSWGSVTNGLWAEVDLQSGTISSATAVGNGTATSTAIVAVGGGFVATLTGKVSSGAATPSVILMAESATNTISFAGATNQCFIYEGVQLVTAASISTTLNVDTDTGWLSGDSIIVAATTRTGADCEDYVLNANAGSSSMTSALYPFGYGGPTTSITGTHNGTSPVQAEVGLLTHNVKIRSTSNSLMSYMYATALATVTVSWVQFYYIGANTVGKRGIEVDGGATCNAKSITYCSIHDVGNGGFYCNASGVTSVNVTFSNNVLWNSSALNLVDITGAITNTDWTFDNNLLMKGSTIGFLLNDLGGTLTNNIATCMGSAGISLQETTSTGSVMGTFDSNTTHSNATHGVICQAVYPIGTISNMASWRNNSTGIFLGVICSASMIHSNVTIFGNASTAGNFFLSGGDTLNIVGSSNIIAGDTSFVSQVGIGVSQTSRLKFNVQNLDMSGTTSIYASHTSTDISLSTVQSICVEGAFANCKFGAPTLLPSKATWSIDSFIGFEKFGQTAGDHRCEMAYGQLKTDTSIFNSASPAMRMTPNSAGNKLESAPKGGKGFFVPVSNGNTASISAYVYKSKTGDGAQYNGNQPRLIQRANAALGQNSDVVLATYGSGTGSWNQLSGNTSTATDDGAFEIIFDCDGTAGWVNVDDLQVA